MLHGTIVSVDPSAGSVTLLADSDEMEMVLSQFTAAHAPRVAFSIGTAEHDVEAPKGAPCNAQQAIYATRPSNYSRWIKSGERLTF
ncbi:hypothetical protein [Sphingomicrobium lutaoense]|uniref:Uncharacterized protein n=1 Tax=Sphingomicrobium lutaoense TaxID=515949 RepID=A0A839Z3M2_9SPHN|nr:hypothetical protein [Sphingomicrobium lutaoense]MBB3764202.1 hypothetical protein [Sphingomicrobium lutaoense]